MPGPGTTGFAGTGVVRTEQSTAAAKGSFSCPWPCVEQRAIAQQPRAACAWQRAVAI